MKSLKNIFLLEADEQEANDSMSDIFNLIVKKFPEIKQKRSIAIISHIITQDINKRKAFYHSYYCNSSFRSTVFDNILFMTDISENQHKIKKLAIVNAVNGPLSNGVLKVQGVLFCYDKNYERQTTAVKDVEKLKTIVRVSSTIDEFLVLIMRAKIL